MTTHPDEQRLVDELDMLVAGVPVGPPPVGEMVRAATTRRRRRGIVALSVAAVLAVAVGVALAAPSRTPLAPADGIPTPPVGMRYVGVHHAMLAVPNAWRTDATACGTPVDDTVVTQVVQPACLVPRAAGVDEVRLFTRSSQPPGFDQAEAIVVDGVPALRTRTSCTGPSKQVCTAGLWVPSEAAWFDVSSTTSSGTVDRLLDSARISPGLVAVPAIYGDVAGNHDARSYLDRLAEAGLRSEVHDRFDDGIAVGMVLSAAPGSGSMVGVGDSVVVYVSDGPEDAAPQLWVTYGNLVDQDRLGAGAIATDPTIDLAVGDLVGLHFQDADGRRMSVDLEGAALAITDSGAWRAVRPGIATLSLSTPACAPGGSSCRGGRASFGTITVRVRTH